MKKVKIITACPSCGSSLERVKDQLFCRNKTCSASQSKRVAGFVKSMKIKGLGEKTIEKLGIETVNDIYLLTKEVMVDIMGEKMGVKLFEEIEASKTTNLQKLLPGFSIPLIGSVASKKLNSIVDTVDKITFEVCDAAGLGEKATNNLIEWIEEEYSQYRTLPITFEELVKPKPADLKNIKVCMTGKLSDYGSRELASTFLESKGITIVSGVSKTLDFLINEDNKPSSKLSKAKSYNIPVVTINELIKEIEK